MFLLITVFFAITLPVLFKVVPKKPKSDFTEWEWHRDLMPIVTKSPTGEKLFQHQEMLIRYNHLTQNWDTKTVVDPIKRPLDKITKWTDSHALLFKN